MEFKIVDHSYENTGGGCMVGFATVWLPQIGKTIFIQTNEMGCSFFSTDTYHFDIEDDVDPFLTLSTDTKITDAPFEDLARECMGRYVKYEQYAALNWSWLSNSIRDQITPHYLNWQKENDDTGLFVVNKGVFVPNDDYVAPPDRSAQAIYHLRYVNLIGSLRNFMDAYLRLCAEWSQSSEFYDLLSEEYPFHVSFDELEIPDWVNNSVFKIMEHMIEKIEEAKEEI